MTVPKTIAVSGVVAEPKEETMNGNAFTRTPRSGSLERFSPPRSLRYAASARAAVMAASLIAAGCLGPAARADSSASPAPQPAAAASDAPGPVLSPSYKLGPDDQLSVKVARHPDFDSDALVLTDGTITLPRIGRIAVAGLTLQDAQELIRQRYKAVFVEPDVTVSIKMPRVRQVQVFGAVNTPGPVEYKEGSRVTDVLARAGGLKLRPTWVTMTLTRREGTLQQLDPEAILDHPDGPANVTVQPGDVLIVQEIPQQPIFVSGEVLKPGMYDLREVDAKRGAIGVLEALTLAGGPTGKASLSKAYILRASRSGAGAAAGMPAAGTAGPAAGVSGAAFSPTSPSGAAAGANPADAFSERRQEEPVDLSRMQRLSAPGAAGSPQEVLLYPGDTLQIPEGTAQIVVMGHVAKPGAFPIPEDRPTYLADAIAMAGGPDERARTSKVGVIRRPDPGQGPTAQPKVIEANLSALLNKSDLKQNVELQPGDVVYVAQTSKPDWFHKVIPGFGAFAQFLFFTGL